MNKQPGSRSCYITVTKLAFFSVETILARTIHISNNILNRFWTHFKNVNPWAKRQEKGICLIFKKIIAHLAHRRALQALIIASATTLKRLLVQAKFTRTLFFGQYMSPMRIIVLSSNTKLGVKALHIVIALNYFTFVCNAISVLVKMENFANAKVDNF